MSSLKKLQKLASFVGEEDLTQLSRKELNEAMSEIMDFLTKVNESNRGEFSKVSGQLGSDLREIRASLAQDVERYKGDLSQAAGIKIIEGFRSRLESIEDGIQARLAELKDGKDGISPELEDVIKELIPYIPKGSPDTGVEIRNKLEHLEGDERLSVDAIAGLDEKIKKAKTPSGGAIVAQRLDQIGDVDMVTTPPTDGQVLAYDATNTKWVPSSAGAGTGDVSKVGTPVDNQVGVWTGNGTIEGDAGFTFDGGLGITVADAENKVGLTINQNDKTNYVPAIELNTSGDQYHPAVLNYYNSYAGTVGQDGDIGTMSFYGKDSAGNKTRFAFFYAGINDNTDTQEDGQFQISVVKAGTSRTLLDMYGNGVNGIYVGSSAVGPGVVSSAGSQDLTLQTGNATTGNITIVDGADGAITIAPNGAGTTKVDGTLTPVTTNDGALGTAALQWEDLFLAEGGVINWDNGDVTLTQTGNVLAVSGGDLQVATAGVGTNADSVPTLSSTNTLTNKRITPRAGTTTSSATPTINTDNYDYYSLTAQTVDITSFTTNLSGTPTDGQKLWISITGTAARAITWGSSFEASTIALPTTTVTTNRLDVGFVWNAATSKWRCVASA